MFIAIILTLDKFNLNSEIFVHRTEGFKMYSLCGALNTFIIIACRDERYSLRKYYFKI